jgi:hypothetical protein
MKNKSYSSVLIFRKLKTDADLIGAAEHNARWKKPKNANPARSGENINAVGGDKSILDLVRDRIKTCQITPRTNAVLALEFVLSAGRDFFKNIKPRENEWVKSATDFLGKICGLDNVVHVSLHKDESTTHLHALVVPIVKANDKEGPFRKNHKHRVWKLDAKGIFEKFARERDRGRFDRSAASFCQSDFKTPFKFIQKMIAKADPVSVCLVNKMEPAALVSFSDRKTKLSKKRKILIAEMNRILAGPSLYYEPVFAQLQLPPETVELKNQCPTGDDLYCLNRRLIEAAYDGLIIKGIGRPIGNPTAPYMHDLQVKYFGLCQEMDKEISAPLYGAKMCHQRLTEFYAALEKGMKSGEQVADVQVNPKPILMAAGQHAEEETARIKESLSPLIASHAEVQFLRHENEELKAGIRQLNDKYAQDKQDWVTESASLKAANDDLRHQMRLIPLDQVMKKLGYPHVPGKPYQFQMPDERVIEISEPVTGNAKASFKDISGHTGLGQMGQRTSGKGAIDLVMFLTGWDLMLTQKWLNNNFALDEVLNVSADKIKDELRLELGQPATAEHSRSFANRQVAPFVSDSGKWLQVRQSLTADYGLDWQMLEDLRQKNLIDANQHGSLVCVKRNGKQFVGGTALGLKPNPLTGTTSVYETSDDNGYPFILGNPQAEIFAIVASPLEALAFYELSGCNSRVLASQSPLPPAIVADLKQHVADTNQPVFLAYGWSPEDEEFAKKMKSQLETAGVATTSCRPPILHDQLKSWDNLLLATKGKLKKSVSVSPDSIKTALENFKEQFGVSPSPTPASPDIGQTNGPQIR